MRFMRKRRTGVISILSAAVITGTVIAGGFSGSVIYADDTAGEIITEESVEQITSDIEEQPTGDSGVSESAGVSAGAVVTTEVTTKKEGFYNEGGSWIYYIGGKAVTTGSDIVYGTINGKTAWYYIKNGKADLSKTSVENNKNGWWYVKNGAVDFSYNGFAQNQHGWWYIQNGKVTFTKSEVTYGTVAGDTAWWNVKGSKVIFNESIEPNQHGWWYVNNGKVDFTKTSVEHNQHGWWYVQNGKVNFGYNGFAQNKHGWWYIQNGKVTFTKSEVTYGTVNGVTAWWNVKGSKVTFNDSMEPNQHGWWYIKNGKVDFGYTGVGTNQHGTWYIKNGKVDFSYTGVVTSGGKKYNIVKGKATGGISKSGDDYYYFNSSGQTIKNTEEKVGQATIKTDGNGVITSVDYDVKTWINQLDYYGCWPMACGAAATLMALQANGYADSLSGEAGWNSLMNSFRAVRGSSYGKRWGNGVMTATQMQQCLNKNSVTVNVPTTPVTGSGVTMTRIKDALSHGQTVSALVALKSTTHWIAITGWYKSGNTTMYRVADPFPKDGKAANNYVTTVTKREDAYYSDRMSADSLWSILNASHLISNHGGRHMLLIGSYK